MLKRFFQGWIFFILMAALPSVAAIQSNPAPAAAAFERAVPRPEASGAFFQPVLALGEDYPSDRTTEAKTRDDMKIISDLNVRYLRCGFSWFEIEPERGVFKWEPWDRLVRIATEHGIELMPYVSYTPEWAATKTEDVTAQPPRDLKEYGRFMHQIALRYRKEIRFWELWNEPDMEEWKGAPAEFAALLMEAADQVRRANPAAKVILAGMARGPSEIFVDLMTTQNIGGYFDIFALHAYAESWLTERLEDVFPRWPETMAGLIAHHAPGRPLWLNEYGYPDWRFKPNRASMWSDSPDVFYEYEHTPRYQAVELMKTMVLALASRYVTMITWYRIRDYANIADVGGQDAVNQHLGLVDVHGKPKPAYGAFKFAGELFSQPLRRIDGSLKIVAPASSQARVHAIERRDGSVIIAGWLRASHAGEVADHSGTLQDPRREEVKITLPDKDLDPARLRFFDAQGRRISINVPYDPKTNTLTLSLTGGDLVLLVTPPAD